MSYLIHSDCLEAMRKMPAKSVDSCITSPPYFGLRDYRVEGQLGLEDTPLDYVKGMVSVFREVHRVLKDEGTLWLNIGDSYASFRDGKTVSDSLRKSQDSTTIEKGKAKNRSAETFKGTSIKHKDIIGIPWRLAFALQDDGWHLRQDIIWSKPNPRPESVKDRCTKSHEYLFLLTKSEHYYFDAEAIAEPAVSGGGGLRNKRSVWAIPTKSIKDAHFATFPFDLVEPCVLAGCPEGGTILDPFFGSGTTGLAAEKNNRNYIGIDLNPDYIQVANRRLNTQQQT